MGCSSDTTKTPPSHEPKACRSCGASIYWAQLVDERGEVVKKPDGAPKAIPVDATPTEKGNVQLYARGTGIVARVLGVEQAKQIRDAAWALGGKHTLRVSHFATCKQAEEWRTSKKVAAAMERISVARQAIVATGLKSGVIACPVCNADNALRFMVSPRNNHVHAACSTQGCVSWME
jgi:hypothetical protein